MKFMLIISLFLFESVGFSKSIESDFEGDRNDRRSSDRRSDDRRGNRDRGDYCSISYSVRSRALFDTERAAQDWCGRFGNYSQHCRYRKSDADGKYRALFLFRDRRDYYSHHAAMNGYYNFLIRNGFLADRYSHFFKLKNCLQPRRR